MNVATTSSIANTNDVSSTQSKNSGSQKTSEKSFDEEMKTASKTEEPKETKETEKAEDKKENKISDKETKNPSEKAPQQNQTSEDFITNEILNGEINFTDFKYHNESQAILSQNIQSLLDTKDLMSIANSAPSIEYDVINMSESDANFFVNLVQNTDMTINQANNALIENSQNIQKNIQVSSVLMEKLAQSLKTNQPFRIDFDKDVSVIIKVNKDGSLSANFIPGDKAVEQYLRNNIDNLKNRFDEENLPYSELSYSNSRGNKQQRNKKENDNE